MTQGTRTNQATWRGREVTRSLYQRGPALQPCSTLAGCRLMKATYEAPSISREGTVAQLTAASSHSTSGDGGPARVISPGHTLLPTTS